jgi:hypothetical protein
MEPPYPDIAWAEYKSESPKAELVGRFAPPMTKDGSPCILLIRCCPTAPN